MLVLLSNMQTANAGMDEVGFRAGIQAGSKEEYFQYYSVFAAYGLPGEWRTNSGWGISPQLIPTVGVITGGDTTGFIGEVAVGGVLNKPGSPFSLDAGISADLLNRRTFGRQDFGSILQFGAYVGASFRFAAGAGIGYQIEHISNGHIFYPNGTPNPGLDIHLLTLSWKY